MAREDMHKARLLEGHAHLLFQHTRCHFDMACLCMHPRVNAKYYKMVLQDKFRPATRKKCSVLLKYESRQKKTLCALVIWDHIPPFRVVGVGASTLFAGSGHVWLLAIPKDDRTPSWSKIWVRRRSYLGDEGNHQTPGQRRLRHHIWRLVAENSKVRWQWRLLHWVEHIIKIHHAKFHCSSSFRSGVIKEGNLLLGWTSYKFEFFWITIKCSKLLLKLHSFIKFLTNK